MILETDVLTIAYVTAWNRQDHDTCLRIANWQRSNVLGVARLSRDAPLPADPDQADYEEEALAHGVTVHELLEISNAVDL